MNGRANLTAETEANSYPAEGTATLSMPVGVPRKRILELGFRILSSSAMAIAG